MSEPLFRVLTSKIRNFKCRGTYGDIRKVKKERNCLHRSRGKNQKKARRAAVKSLRASRAAVKGRRSSFKE